MKIIKEQFNAFARGQGYESGAGRFDDLGFSAEYYADRREEVRIGGKVFEKLCREIGAAEVMEFLSALIRAKNRDTTVFWKSFKNGRRARLVTISDEAKANNRGL